MELYYKLWMISRQQPAPLATASSGHHKPASLELQREHALAKTRKIKLGRVVCQSLVGVKLQNYQHTGPNTNVQHPDGSEFTMIIY